MEEILLKLLVLLVATNFCASSLIGFGSFFFWLGEGRKWSFGFEFVLRMVQVLHRARLDGVTLHPQRCIVGVKIVAISKLIL